MLLRHPDVAFYEIDRVAFGLLLLGVVGRAMVYRRRLLIVERATWPMIGLTALAVASVIRQPFDHETWSLLASKILVPFAMFHVAGRVFTEERKFRQFEVFALVVLSYLSFTAIAFLSGAHWLIFPRFILDESLGFHADRARGPLLQAVANGVSLNMLGLLALHAYQRRKARGLARNLPPRNLFARNLSIAILLASVPIAILATMTRAVWLSFAGTVVVLMFMAETRALRRACVGLILIAAVGLAVVLSSRELRASLSDRLEERGPLAYRAAVYAGGWDMFLDRPFMGWGFHQMPAELSRHVSGYEEKVLYPHNTYLEVLVEFGMVGLSLYLWLMWELWRLARGAIPLREKKGFLDSQFHRMWPLLLGVYWVNAALVVMSYQFVNALLFTMAGMLAAQQRRARAYQSC
jgi:O-antigen ligase